MTNSAAAHKILIVDDEADIRILLAQAFESSGFKVTQSEDGARGLYMAESDKYSAILLDIKMPKINGAELVARIRSGRINKGTPIFVVTGTSEMEDIKKVVALGVASVLMKPFEATDIVAKVTEKLTAKAPAKVEFAPAFVKACAFSVGEIAQFYLGAAPKVGKPAIKATSQTNGYASGIISFCQNNKVVGSLSLTIDRPFIDALAKSIFAGSTVEMNQDMIGDMTGEMCNQLVGRLKINLAKEQYYITIGLPEVIVGENHSVIHKSKNPVLTIPLVAPSGQAAIEICLLEAIETGGAPEESSQAQQDSGALFF
jgi:DNA-binding response OmpR family regulator